MGGVEEGGFARFDGQFDPSIDQFLEDLVGGNPRLDFPGAIGADEAADGFAAIDVGKFAVGAVAAGGLGVHAAATGTATDLILPGDAAGVHGAEREEAFANAGDFAFQSSGGKSSFHDGYVIYHIRFGKFQIAPPRKGK